MLRWLQTVDQNENALGRVVLHLLVADCRRKLGNTEYSNSLGIEG